MLVLTRKTNESIIIGDNVKITVIEVKGEQVKLGISAPKKISVHREEIYLEIQNENRLASETGMGIKELDQIWQKKQEK